MKKFPRRRRKMLDESIEAMNERMAVFTKEECKDKSILELMETINKHAEESELDDKYFYTVSPMSEELATRLELTPRQAVLLSVFVDNFGDESISLRDIQQQTEVPTTRWIRFQPDILELERRRYIRRSTMSHCSESAYRLPGDVIKALCENRAFVPEQRDNLSAMMFLHCLNEEIEERYSYHEPYSIMCEEIKNLVNLNMHLKVAQELYSIMDKTLSLGFSEWPLLAVLLIVEMFNKKRFGLSNLSRVFEDIEDRFYQNEIESERLYIQKKGYVEFGFSDGMQDRNVLVLSAKGKKVFLSEVNIPSAAPSNLTMASSISKKTLFFDNEVKTQVDRLDDMLTDKSFRQICSRLRKFKMRQGFACLFYGAPGTGKTETVLQLARKTGRNIIQVDFSQVKDKWVGESEKNVMAIFENYREVKSKEKRCPILLFNEADAIISKRLTNVEHSVDNMNNAMQNIILQEMEDFEGILIATTNLVSNFDPAFERRFLYKVCFEKPSANVRKQIWQSIIPDLSDETAIRLANEHEFSGGQIENIARKQIVDTILYGETDDVYAKLKEYCNSEKIMTGKTCARIGFNRYIA